MSKCAVVLKDLYKVSWASLHQSSTGTEASLIFSLEIRSNISFWLDESTLVSEFATAFHNVVQRQEFQMTILR